jgi:hypothetical protein
MGYKHEVSNSRDYRAPVHMHPSEPGIDPAVGRMSSKFTAKSQLREIRDSPLYARKKQKG